MHVVETEFVEGVRMPLHAGVALTASGIAAVAVATAVDR